jgi:DnaJ-class molecular chaperone
MAATPKPTYWTALNVEQGASKQKIVAAYRKLAKELHPDNGNGESALFTLVTAAYNVLKSDPQHVFGSKADLTWQRDYLAATAKPKAESKARKTNDGWVFEEREGESKEDRRRRYARERQQYRYANDPDFAAARKAASLKSHKKTNDRRKAEREAAEKNAPAAA